MSWAAPGTGEKAWCETLQGGGVPEADEQPLGLVKFAQKGEHEPQIHRGVQRIRMVVAENPLLRGKGIAEQRLGLGVPAGGLIAASGGNHGIAVARTARVLGVKAEIFVPGVSSPAKIDRLPAQGAMVNIVGELYDDAQEACDARAASIDALKVHPYNAPLTVAGQATVGVELVKQVPGLGFQCSMGKP